MKNPVPPPRLPRWAILSALFVFTTGLLVGQDEVSGDFVYPEPCGCGGVVELTIYNGLYGNFGGQMVPDGDEESLGAITVANLNDTDGDGVEDANDNEVVGSATGRDEVDLMRLDIVLTDQVAPTCPTVDVALSPGLRLWQQSTKTTLAPLNIPTDRFDNNDRRVTLWVEATQVSEGLRDMWISAALTDPDAGSVKGDRVVVTAIWFELLPSYFARSSLPTTSSLGINESDLVAAINTQYKSVDGTLYGHGLYADQFDGVNTVPADMFDNYAGGRILHQFEVRPLEFRLSGARNQYNLSFDITRRIKDTVASINPLHIYQTTAQNGYPQRIEQANDDSDNLDEDLKPRQNFPSISSFDAPGILRTAGRDLLHIRHLHFEEFVRVSFQDIIPPNGEFGSKSSEVRKWAMSNALVRNGSSSTLDPHAIENTFLNVLPPGIIASNPVRLTTNNTGTGQILITPNSLTTSWFDGYRLVCEASNIDPPTPPGSIQWKLLIKNQATTNTYDQVTISNSSVSGPWTLTTPELTVIINNDPTSPYVAGATLQFIVLQMTSPRNYILNE